MNWAKQDPAKKVTQLKRARACTHCNWWSPYGYRSFSFLSGCCSTISRISPSFFFYYKSWRFSFVISSSISPYLAFSPAVHCVLLLLLLLLPAISPKFPRFFLCRNVASGKYCSSTSSTHKQKIWCKNSINSSSVFLFSSSVFFKKCFKRLWALFVDGF